MGKPLYRQPLFQTVFVLFVLLLIYLYSVFSLPGSQRPWALGLGLIVGVVTFTLITGLVSRYLLPVNTVDGFVNVFTRLLGYLFRSRGPVMFIEKGQPVESQKERERFGPGVLLIDNNSAAVIRTGRAYRGVEGPGVHFTQPGEYLAEAVDLRPQVRRLAGKEPRLGEVPESAEMSSLALTLDGVPISADLSVEFMIDNGQDPPPGRDSKKAKDPLISFDEVPGPPVFNDEVRRSVALAVYGHAYKEHDDHPWSDLPMRLVVDVWRELVRAWPLDPLVRGISALDSWVETMLEELENESGSEAENTRRMLLELWGRDLEEESRREAGQEGERRRYVFSGDPADEPGGPSSGGASPVQAVESEPLPTPLEIIAARILMRLRPPDPGETAEISREARLLGRRGIRVFGVRISNLHLPQSIQDEYLARWREAWSGQATDRLARSSEEVRARRLEGEKQAFIRLREALTSTLRMWLTEDTSRRDALEMLLTDASAFAADARITSEDGDAAGKLDQIVRDQLPAQQEQCWSWRPLRGR